MKSLEALLLELRNRDVKLWLEDDRLRYRAPQGSLSSQDLAELRDRKVELIAFLQTLKPLCAVDQQPLQAIPREGSFPLSFAQQRLWFLYQFEPDSPANNMPVVIRFTGNLNREILQRSLQTIIQRHEVLRSRFPQVNGQPMLVINSDFKIELPIVDLQSIPEDQRSQELHRRATSDAQAPFDLEAGPLLRLKLFQMSAQEHVLLWNMPCIICDGTSSDLFYRELTTCYTAYTTNSPLHLPELPIQYVDFAHWQRQYLQGERLDSHLRYWQQQLTDNLSSLQLATDYPRPTGLRTCQGNRYARMLSKTLHEALTTLSHELGTTLFVVLLATFTLLLHRHSQQKDVLTTFVSSGRNRVELENLIGFFSNTLVLHTRFKKNLSFRELVQQIHRQNLDAYSHQDLPFERLVDALTPEQRQGRSPLFQTKFTLNPPWTNGQGMGAVVLADLKIESLFGYIYHGKTKYDVILVTREQDEGLGAVFDYNAELFKESTIQRMMDHFETLLESIVINPDQEVAALPLLKPSEQQQLLAWTQTATAYPDTHCIHELFEATVDQTPDAIALIAQDQQLTYRELDQRANQLAHYLQSQGVGPEVLVALSVERSPDLLVGMLGVLKAGGAYIPLDPSYPHERRLNKLRNAQAHLLLTQAQLAPLFDSCGLQVVALDRDWEMIAQASVERVSSSVTARNLAYVIYTSGSTGEPKGVMITHQGLINHCLAVAKVYELTSSDRVLQFSNISFDITVEELFPTWTYGGTVVLASAEMVSSTTQFLQGITQQAITVLNLPTAFWHEWVNGMQVLQQELPASLRLVIVGGEKVAKSIYQEWRSQFGAFPRWLNAYGPTETTVTATIYDPTTSEDNLHSEAEIPIGQAIANVQTYVLDSSLQLCPIGVPGELYIGGVGVSRGYLHRPELTKTRFIPNPFSQNAEDKLYKTGDIVRYLPNGHLEFIGRSDFQIKLRGFRIEPIEIETQLEKHPAVQQAIVLCRTNNSGDPVLTAYLVTRDSPAPSFEQIREFLKLKLPAYMLPGSIVCLESFPLTGNGKVDRQALPHPDQNLLASSLPVAYRDQLEKQLTEIWQVVLGLPNIGIHDNFFDLGGHSLLAVRLFAQIEETFGKSLPLATLLKAPTIEQLAVVLRQDTHQTPWSPLVEIQPQGSKPPLFCVHGGGFNVLIYRYLSINLGNDQPVYALQARGLDGNQPIINRLEEMAIDYVQEVQRIQPQGPYLFAGLSNGGNIALEMAQQLREQGQTVALVAMFDSFGPDSIKLLPPFPRFLSSLYYALRYSLPRWAGKILQLKPEFVLSALQNIIKTFQPSKSVSLTSEMNSDPLKTNPSNFAGEASFMERIMNRCSDYVLKRSAWFFLNPSAQLQDMDDTVSQKLKQLEETYSKVHKAYVPKPYPGKIVLFRATEQPPGYWLDPYLGWKNIPQDGLSIYRIPGHHISIMESTVLAEKMRICLEQAIASVQPSCLSGDQGSNPNDQTKPTVTRV